MPGNVLVDSSFFIDRLRAGDDPLVELTEDEDQWELVTCGVVVAEVLRGMKHRGAHKRMADFMGCMLYVPTLNPVWDRVAELAWQLDCKGQWVSIPDLTIAVCALEVEAAVLTVDSDFERIPGLRLLKKLD